MKSDKKLRLSWVKFYFDNNCYAGKTCAHFGISRPTLSKWLKRYDLSGDEGLIDLSRKPHNSPKLKVNNKVELIILDLRKNRKLGSRRIKNELKRLHNISLSLATIHKVLQRSGLPYLKKKRHYRKAPKLYNCSVPGQRVQMDVCKITNGLYQYTAIDH